MHKTAMVVQSVLHCNVYYRIAIVLLAAALCYHAGFTSVMFAPLLSTLLFGDVLPLINAFIAISMLVALGHLMLSMDCNKLPVILSSGVALGIGLPVLSELAGFQLPLGRSAISILYTMLTICGIVGLYFLLTDRTHSVRKGWRTMLRIGCVLSITTIAIDSSLSIWLRALADLVAVGQATMATLARLVIAMKILSVVNVALVGYALAVVIGFRRFCVPKGCCRDCGYELRFASSHVCPECGRVSTAAIDTA